jgi:hypothetical protein
MARTIYVYEPPVLDALSEHGLHPQPATPPDVVRGALSDLYRYEIRRLKQRLLRGEFSKDGYSPRVIELRRKYWLLSVPIAKWARQESRIC